MSLLARILVFLFELLPKVGPLQTLAFKPPTPQAQKLFVKSFNDVVARYEALLTAEGSNQLVLSEKNFDTGKPTQAGAYQLADDTYAQLLHRLASQHFKGTTPELRSNILAFYANLKAPIATKDNPKQWQETLQNLAALKSAVITAPNPPRNAANGSPVY